MNPFPFFYSYQSAERRHIFWWGMFFKKPSYYFHKTHRSISTFLFFLLRLFDLSTRFLFLDPWIFCNFLANLFPCPWMIVALEAPVATERVDKSWSLSALIIPASTCFFRKSMDSCSFAFFDFITSISCNLALRYNEISAFFLLELIFSRSLLYLCEAYKQLLWRSPHMVNSLTEHSSCFKRS